MTSNDTTDKLILAVPKGRILEELTPLIIKAGITPEKDFFNPKSRKLQFSTNIETLDIIRVRSFDVATFVAFGAAQIGVAGNDVLLEFDYPEVYAPLDLGIGKCRLCIAEPKEQAEHDDPSTWSHIRIATKYPALTKAHFKKRGVQAECITLSGAMELAPSLGLCQKIVDLVSTGRTLEENGLTEIETIQDISARLIINRTAFKTCPPVKKYLKQFEQALKSA